MLLPVRVFNIQGQIKVKWDQLLCPEEEGGLGFKRVKEWNRVAMLIHCGLSAKKLLHSVLNGCIPGLYYNQAMFIDHGDPL